MDKKHIFIPLYRSFGFRYLEASGILKELSKKYKIVLFIDFNKKKFFENFFSNYDVILEDLNVYELNFTKFPRLKGFKNMLKRFFNGNKRNFRNNSHNLWKIKFKKELKAKKITLIIYAFAFLLNNIKFLRKIFFFIESKLDHKKIYNKYFDKYSPVLLLTTSYGYDYDQYFVREAKSKGCKTISIVYSWDNPSSKGYKLSNSDLYLVWNETMKKEMVIFQDIEENKIKKTGMAHWDTYYKDLKNKDLIKKQFFKENNFSPDDKVILYLSSSPRDFFNAYDKIEKLCKIFKNEKNIKIIARMHPHYMNDSICIRFCGNNHKYFEKELLSKYSNILLFKNPQTIVYGSGASNVIYPADDIENLKKLYSSASLLLNEYSTTLLEGIIYDLAIINVAIGKYRDLDLPIKTYGLHHHLYKLQKYNAVLECENYESLELIIKKILSGIDETRSNRKKLFNDELNIFTGEASKKILNEIIEFERA